MAFILWMTGLPCSGKSTIARKLNEDFPKMEILDGDELHKILSMNNFSREERLAQTGRIAYIAKLLLKHDVSVCVSVVTPFHESRELVRKIVDDKRLIITYLKCSLDMCISRDVKGMYKKTNDITQFTGPYEYPNSINLTIDTENNTIEKSIDEIKKYLDENILN